MKIPIEKFLISENYSIQDSLIQINNLGHNTIFIVDKNKILKGSLTEGDIRRALLNKSSIKTNIKNIYNKKPKFLIDKQFTEQDIRKLFTGQKINLIPILNKNKKILDVISWQSYFINENKKLKKINYLSNIPVVIMAGGKGSRLKPFTNILPKPLLPIDNKPIIEHIIDKFVMYGVKNFFISINVKNFIIKAFFRERKFKEKISFLEEKKSLGTCGSLGLLKQSSIKDNFMMINCDCILDINYKKLLIHHINNSAILTIVVVKKNHTMPYGTIEVDEKGFLLKINEKPSFNLSVNVGMYVINKKCLHLIPKNKPIDMNVLINSLKIKKYPISVFEIKEELWFDTGQIDKLKEAKNYLEKNE